MNEDDKMTSEGEKSQQCEGHNARNHDETENSTSLCNFVSKKVGEKLAPYNPTNMEAIEIALRLLQIVSHDVIYDLGCGDARFLIYACQHAILRCLKHVQCIGVEYDSDLCGRAQNSVAEANLQDHIQILHENVIDVNFQDIATVLFVYLVPAGMQLLKERLLRVIARGGRIVTYVFSIPDVKPREVVIYKGSTKLYLY
jgi:cyclopropane fatty-acyl-phospholipid synthase-like methyltransferase